MCIFAKMHFCALLKTNFLELSKFIKFSQFSYFERNPIFCIQNLFFDVYICVVIFINNVCREDKK